MEAILQNGLVVPLGVLAGLLVVLLACVIVAIRRTGSLLSSLQETRNQFKSEIEANRKSVIEHVETHTRTIHNDTKNIGQVTDTVTEIHDFFKNDRKRGNIGELLLEHILMNSISPELYDRQVEVIPGSNNRVDFAVKIPQAGQGSISKFLWLPIDAKFPDDTFVEMVLASEVGDADKVEELEKEYLRKIKEKAKSVGNKYISKDYTTEVAIIYLPSESQFAEVARHPDFLQSVMNEYKVLFAGPTTIMALLSTLQVGLHNWMRMQNANRLASALGEAKRELEKVTSSLNHAQEIALHLEMKFPQGGPGDAENVVPFKKVA